MYIYRGSITYPKIKILNFKVNIITPFKFAGFSFISQIHKKSFHEDMGGFDHVQELIWCSSCDSLFTFA
jgi:hypothetical protein